MKERIEARIDALVAWVRDVPRPTRKQLLKLSPLLVAAVVLLVLLGRNYDTVDFPRYEVPEGFVPRPPPTTRPLGAELPSLAAVAGTTVVPVPDNVGTAQLGGTVTGPLGAIPGAVVRIERTILGTTQTYELATDAAGGSVAAGIGGGRYRVRAFLPPFLASRTAEVFMLPAGDSRTLDLVLEEFNQPSLSLASAPAPALLDQQVNVAARVVGRFVDADGFVGVQGLPGATVDIQASNGWVRSTPAGSLTTDADGRVVVTFTCRQLGPAQVTATMRTAADATPVVATATFDCVDPASLTTTTVAGDGSTPSSSTSTSISTSTTTATTAPP